MATVATSYRITFIWINRLKNTLYYFSGNLASDAAWNSDAINFSGFTDNFMVSILSLQVSMHSYVTYLPCMGMGYHIAENSKTYVVVIQILFTVIVEVNH